MSKSLYIHIPFCRNKCPYCDFYSIRYNRELAKLYIEIINLQLEQQEENFSTIYIGGGTPTVLDIDILKGLLKRLKGFFKTATEITIEANPESLNKEKLQLLFDAGVNRLSIGAQSFLDNKLKILERIHSSKETLKNIYLAKRIGFKNINLDLIFGVPQETLNSWERDLNYIRDLPIQHLSLYILSPEGKSPFYKKIKTKELILADEKEIVKMYRYNCKYLTGLGFKQYEISNFAKEKYECKHNLHYWQNEEYIGLGPSAVSYIEGSRQRNISNVKAYIRRILKKESPIVFKERLSRIKRAKETATLKIRTREGIDLEWFYNKTGFDFISLEKKALTDLLKDRLIKYLKDKDNQIRGVCLTEKGLLFADIVSSAFL